MQRTLTLLLVIFLAATSIIILPTKAQNRIIIVPDNYFTIESAIADALNGDTIFIRNGSYDGPINQTLVINKQLSIIGESAENTIIKLHPAYNVSWLFATPFFDYSEAIAINADNCKFYNVKIEIQNPGGTISVKGDGLQIIGTDITTGSSNGIEITGSFCKIMDNTIFGSVTINGTFNEVARNSPVNYIFTYGSFNLVRNNTCGLLGLYNSTNNVFLANKMWTDSRMYSGVDLSYSDNNFFYKNQITGYSSGFRFWFSAGNTMVANTVADSLTGSISLGGSSGNRIFQNNFIDNPTWTRGYVYDQYSDPNYRDTYQNMTVSANNWDSGLLGNFWGNYNGTDVNGDGIGDTPYIISGIAYERNQSKREIVYGQDNFPLIVKLNIADVPIDLPQWVSNLPPEPQIIDLQIPEPTPRVTEIIVPTFSSPLNTETPNQKASTSNYVYTTILVIAFSIVVILAVAGLLVYHKKRRRGLIAV